MIIDKSLIYIWLSITICKSTNCDLQRKQEHLNNVYIYNNVDKDFFTLSNISLYSTEILNKSFLEGKAIIVIADNMEPYITYNENTDELDGFLGNIWYIVQEVLKFRTYVQSSDYDTGLDIIDNGCADVMLAAAVFKESLKNVLYSQPYFNNWYHLYLKQPRPKAHSTSYFKIFHSSLWFATLLFLVILTVALWLAVKTLHKFNLEMLISLPSCFLGVIGGFLNQGFDVGAIGYSPRILIMFALILGVVLNSAINAVLVVQLTLFDIPFPFDSLDDVSNHGNYALCLRNNSFVYNNFSDSERNILPKWKHVLNNKRCLDINYQKNLAEIMCKDRIIMLENRVVMTTVIKKYNITCNIINFNEKYFKKDNSFLMSKKFAGARFVDNVVNHIRTTGVLQRLETKWISREKLTDHNIQQTPQITINHVEGVLLLYLSMAILSFLILLIEKMYCRYMSLDSTHHPMNK